MQRYESKRKRLQSSVRDKSFVQHHVSAISVACTVKTMGMIWQSRCACFRQKMEMSMSLKHSAIVLTSQGRWYTHIVTFSADSSRGLPLLASII